MGAPLRFVRIDRLAIFSRGRERARNVVPLLVLLPLSLLLFAGSIFSFLPAFGYLPALGGQGFSLEGWRMLWQAPGIGRSIGVTLGSGFLATAISSLIAFGLLALGDHGGFRASWIAKGAGLILGIPHAALAIGLAFVIAPSGWMVRLLAGCCLLIESPPDYWAPQDPWGLSLTLALILKETPFLILTGLVALRHIDCDSYMKVAQSWGYSRSMAWIKIVVPLLYRQMQLPIFAVLTYALSVVDMSIVLGPSAPPALPLRILNWVNDPDLAQRFTAASGAVLQAGIALASIAFWYLTSRLFGKIARRYLSNGKRDFPKWGKAAAGSLFMVCGSILLFLAIASLVVLFFWSIAGAWPFPSIFPVVDLQWWRQYLDILSPVLGTTLLITGIALSLATLLVLAYLEFGGGHSAASIGKIMIYIPLLVPEIVFLFGIAILFIGLKIEGSILAVVGCHLLFIFPYIYLSFAENWQTLDARYERTAQSLGASRWRVFWRIKLPLLRGPLSNAMAIGFAVSLSLYLPTVLAGAGRISTLASEAIQLSGAGDRRITAIFAFIQCFFIWLAFLLAQNFARPRKIFR